MSSSNFLWLDSICRMCFVSQNVRPGKTVIEQCSMKMFTTCILLILGPLLITRCKLSYHGFILVRLRQRMFETGLEKTAEIESISCCSKSSGKNSNTFSLLGQVTMTHPFYFVKQIYRIASQAYNYCITVWTKLRC